MIWLAAGLLLGLAADPATLAITSGPCNGRAVTVRMTNDGPAPVYADAVLAASPGLHLPRRLISTWLPPGYTRSVPVMVSAAVGTRAGVYHVRVSGGGRRIDVPVTVTAPAPDAALVRLAARVTASSARASGGVCAAIDGDPGTMWNDATGRRWPDRWQLAWDRPHRVGLVRVVTTARGGLRDWDVQVAVPAGWETVAAVRGNTAVEVTSTFAARRATAVRIVTLAGNGAGDQSRLAEVVIR
ncbi:hypothetical protein [Actinoplanes teichomyceticus]|uniref:F5/8 type C domain-containing protein n=1 Tax=Actinoplanes teichomyceticus TaxID=1867 RepID=A0A561VJ19_ACTTI|nr:hypothetical protein [Actinoplanes teichomyceticus]TWG11635.1 hypothetical protein FHX34_106365 [Actinoplanes teichomyceticus]GIF16083.1 hypothetical protein Ate01nite_61150 [Actinoplanes teichomyceticus]